jgi:hypothetical protein
MRLDIASSLIECSVGGGGQPRFSIMSTLCVISVEMLGGSTTENSNINFKTESSFGLLGTRALVFGLLGT